MAIVGRAKYTRARKFEETRREISRARVYFFRPTIAIAKIRDYSQSIILRTTPHWSVRMVSYNFRLLTWKQQKKTSETWVRTNNKFQIIIMGTGNHSLNSSSLVHRKPFSVYDCQRVPRAEVGSTSRRLLQQQSEKSSKSFLACHDSG